MSVYSDHFAHEQLKFLTGQANAIGAEITPWLALFSTLPDLDGSGGVEETGPSLARKNSDGLWGVPANRTINNSLEIDFGSATGDLERVYGIGILDGSVGGTLWAICRLHGQRFDFSTDYGTDANQLVVPAHPYNDGDRVQLVACPGFDLPSGVSANSTYYVVNSGAGILELSLTNGGAAIDIGSDGAGFVVKDNSKLIEYGDQVKISVGELEIELV